MNLSRREFIGGLALLALGNKGFGQKWSSTVNAPCIYSSKYTLTTRPYPADGKENPASITEQIHQRDHQCHIKYRGSYPEDKEAKGKPVFVEVAMYDNGNVQLFYSSNSRDTEGKLVYYSEDLSQTKIHFLLPPGSRIERELQIIERGEDGSEIYGVPKDSKETPALKSVNLIVERDLSVSDEGVRIFNSVIGFLKDEANLFGPRKLEEIKTITNLGFPFKGFDSYLVYTPELSPAWGDMKDFAHTGRRFTLVNHIAEEGRSLPIGIWIPKLVFSNQDQKVSLSNMFFEIEPQNKGGI